MAWKVARLETIYGTYKLSVGKIVVNVFGDQCDQEVG